MNGKGYDKNVNIIYKLNNRKGTFKELYENGTKKFDLEYSDKFGFGKGKEYNENGIIKFEGEYLNFKRWNGKGYDINNKIIYELNDGEGYVY